MRLAYRYRRMNKITSEWNLKKIHPLITTYKIPKTFFEIALFPYSDFPLRFAFIFGFLSFFVCIIVMLRTLYLFFSGSESISSTSIFVAILFFAGIQSFITGILAMYIGMVHKETMKRPLYIIEEAIGFEGNNNAKL